MKDNNLSGRLVVNKVTHRYGNHTVLNNFHLSVNPNELVVLVGPSGCGKTTLLNLLSGHTRPDVGIIKRRGAVRTVYQHDGLFPWLTVKENIRMGLQNVAEEKQREHELNELLELVHMNGFENHYPHQISGGMRQRVELARAVAGNSDILLMDEPFCSLDYQTRLHMRRELLRLLEKRPRTVVFVTHDIEEAVHLADRVLVLSRNPATVVRELFMDSPKPRDLTDANVIRSMKTIFYELGLQTFNLPNVNTGETSNIAV